MARIFLSYRREDASGHARHLFEHLASRYGTKNVFMDVATLHGGDRFVDRIDQAVERSDAFLALIGKRWLDARDDSGRRRLDLPEDYVRREIASALARKMNVVPVLLDSATMPPADQLPEELKEITRRNAVELTSARWEYELENLLKLLPPPPRRWLVRSAAVGGAVVGLLVAFLWLKGVMWPAPKPMTGIFNVAVLDFSERDAQDAEMRSSVEGQWIADRVNDSLQKAEDELKQEPNSAGVVEIQRLQRTVKGRSTDIARSLVKIADDANATIVVHGVLELSAPYRFTPYLYLTQQFNGGEELTGESAFGSPIEVTLPLDNSGLGRQNRLAVAENLGSRLKALQMFTLGLAYMQIAKPDRALELFERADQVGGWSSDTKVLELFRGSALVLLDRGDEAHVAYEKSLELSGGKYGRALVGRGNLFYRSGRIDRAADYYRRALESEGNSPAAYVGAKARFNLGLALATLARTLGETCEPGEARAVLEAVVAAYKEDPEVEILRELAFKAHYHRGVLSQTCADSATALSAIEGYRQAVEQFEAALLLGEPVATGRSSWSEFLRFGGTRKIEERPWQRNRWVVWKLLGYSQWRLAELGQPDFRASAVASLQRVTARFESAGDVTGPVAADAYTFLGQALARTDPAAAAAAAKKAAEIKSRPSP